MSRSSLPDDRRAPLWPFYRATAARDYVTVVSEVAFYQGHWDAGARRSIRCEGAGCLWCAGSVELRTFVYTLIEDQEGHRYLMEWPRRARELADDLYRAGSGAAGVGLVVWKEGDAKNSAILVVRSGMYELVEGVDIWPIVSRLGSPSPAKSNPTQPLQGPPDRARSAPNGA